MSAAQTALQFPIARKDEAPQSHGVRSHCTWCDGSGWRPVATTDGSRRVTRCECITRRRDAAALPSADYKAAAAGERS